MFLSMNIVLTLTSRADPDEMHFIWVFTVCPSIHLGVSGIQNVLNSHAGLEMYTFIWRSIYIHNLSMQAANILSSCLPILASSPEACSKYHNLLCWLKSNLRYLIADLKRLCWGQLLKYLKLNKNQEITQHQFCFDIRKLLHWPKKKMELYFK